MGITILLILVGLGVCASMIAERRRLKHVLSSACAGRSWRRAFPKAEKGDIRHFLDIVIRSFGITRKYRLRLTPDLTLKDLYEALYPPKLSLCDCMEVEDFIRQVHEQYAIDLTQYPGEDLTLGDVFALVPQSRSDPARRPLAGPYCRKCGYILRGLSEPRCPECGEAI